MNQPIYDECSTISREQYDRIQELTAKLPPVTVVSLEASPALNAFFEKPKPELYDVLREVHVHALGPEPEPTAAERCRQLLDELEAKYDRSKGFTFTFPEDMCKAAAMMVFANYQPAKELQREDRIHRVGQPVEPTIIDIDPAESDRLVSNAIHRKVAEHLYPESFIPTDDIHFDG